MTESNNRIKYLVVDVDGTLTDAGIYYDDSGNELKRFSTRDSAGFHAAKAVGIKIIILTGRECIATTRRLTEMKVDYLFQGVRDKYSFLKKFMLDKDIKKEQIAYIGDDLNDLPPMSLVGYVGCPADSCKEVKKIANYVSPIKGGAGAVRDVIQHYLEEIDEWDNIFKELYFGGF